MKTNSLVDLFCRVRWKLFLQKFAPRKTSYFFPKLLSILVCNNQSNKNFYWIRLKEYYEANLVSKALFENFNWESYLNMLSIKKGRVNQLII